MHRIALCFSALLGCVLMSGCSRLERASADQGKGPPGQPAAAAVVVSQPVIREVTDFEDFPGRTESVAAVEIRARVTGYLEKSHLRNPANREGKEFAEGETLFEIDLLYGERAAARGIAHFARAPPPNARPDFLEALADVALSAP